MVELRKTIVVPLRLTSARYPARFMKMIRLLHNINHYNTTYDSWPVLPDGVAMSAEPRSRSLLYPAMPPKQLDRAR